MKGFSEKSISECPRKGKALSFTAIGNRKPAGICGSGIIDLLAQMRLNGWINIAGELNQDVSNRIVYLEEEPQYAAIYALPEESASGQPLYFSRRISGSIWAPKPLPIPWWNASWKRKG